MERQTAYVLMKNADQESLAAFFAAYGDIAVTPAGPDLFRLSYAGAQDDADLRRVRELAVQEFIQDLTVFVVPAAADYPVAAVLKELPRLGHGIYGAAEIATEAVMRDLSGLHRTLRDYYVGLVGAETVDTAVGFIRADQNASRAARALYMHRNTLNYRLDHFLAKTGIDVRTFTGGLAVYLLFRH
ncbi:MAG: helix-turn-helix domain-containing protein [Candidatus Izemoplasmatales bacterium]